MESMRARSATAQKVATPNVVKRVPFRVPEDQTFYASRTPVNERTDGRAATSADQEHGRDG